MIIINKLLTHTTIHSNKTRTLHTINTRLLNSIYCSDKICIYLHILFTGYHLLFAHEGKAVHVLSTLQEYSLMNG